jgi:hypothetical protein
VREERLKLESCCEPEALVGMMEDRGYLRSRGDSTKRAETTGPSEIHPNAKPPERACG